MAEPDDLLGVKPTSNKIIDKDSQEQSKIKSAVIEDSPSIPSGNQFAMEQSIMNQPESPSVPAEQAPQAPAPGQSYSDYSPQLAQENYYQYPQQQDVTSYDQQQYPQYQQYSSGLSSDTITEISEQVVSEKITELKDELDKVIDFRNTIETKVTYIEERLVRIEKVIDRLQLSILQRVGDYMSDIEDIKKEMIETQKTFKSLVTKSPAFSDMRVKDGKEDFNSGP